MASSSSSSRPSPDGRRAERRQAIIEVAARLFAELGYTECEMERVATEQGIAKGTLYLYFPSKEDLFYACVDHGMRQMQTQVGEAARAVTEPFERIRLGIRAYLEFFDRHPHYAELLIQERANFKHRKKPTYFEYRDAHRDPWREMYTQLVATGRLRDDLPVERLLDTIGNLLYGTMFTNHFLGRTVTLEEQYQAMVEIVLRGIMSDSERGSASA